jgi:hypothetical protein
MHFYFHFYSHFLAFTLVLSLFFFWMTFLFRHTFTLSPPLISFASKSNFLYLIGLFGISSYCGQRRTSNLSIVFVALLYTPKYLYQSSHIELFPLIK